ncbi:hypothetical protein ACFWMR_02165 [Amycolatopsis thailandensis]|uniref:hypothetical protein n=1 Tax=Amycolatopsis thailandensis TaxID=589330 RepID=UPI00365136CA
MTEPEFTADQIVDGIHCALADGEVAVVPGLLKLLAVQDPGRAEHLLNTIEAGLALARNPDARLVETLTRTRKARS